jgi:hypothetical protein
VETQTQINLSTSPSLLSTTGPGGFVVNDGFINESYSDILLTDRSKGHIRSRNIPSIIITNEREDDGVFVETTFTEGRVGFYSY